MSILGIVQPQQKAYRTLQQHFYIYLKTVLFSKEKVQVVLF